MNKPWEGHITYFRNMKYDHPAWFERAFWFSLEIIVGENKRKKKNNKDNFNIYI